MTSGAVQGFLPSSNGLRFTNAWPHVPTVRIGLGPFGRLGFGDAADGLCGGMAFTVADLFVAGVAPPPDDAPPGQDSERYRYVVARQVDSLAFGRLPLEFYRYMSVGGATRARLVAADEWPRIRADLDAGRLAMLGLVRVSSANPFDLTRNHQVMAYAYELDGTQATIRIYEPNYGPRDDVSLALELSADGRMVASLGQSTGEPLVALFRAPYSPREPGPWRS